MIWLRSLSNTVSARCCPAMRSRRWTVARGSNFRQPQQHTTHSHEWKGARRAHTRSDAGVGIRPCCRRRCPCRCCRWCGGSAQSAPSAAAFLSGAAVRWRCQCRCGRWIARPCGTRGAGTGARTSAEERGTPATGSTARQALTDARASPLLCRHFGAHACSLTHALLPTARASCIRHCLPEHGFFVFQVLAESESPAAQVPFRQCLVRLFSCIPSA
jgi:hypothetical protein